MRLALTAARRRGPILDVGRALRSFAAALAGLALVASLPAPCACLGKEAAAPRSEHACCAPPPGVSGNDHGCCDGRDRAGSDLLTHGPLPPPGPSGVAVVRAEPAVRLAATLLGSALTSPSPPPAVLRI
jgi:hypothetical protein